MTPHTSARRAAPPKGAATSQAIDGTASRLGFYSQRTCLPHAANIDRGGAAAIPGPHSANQAASAAGRTPVLVEDTSGLTSCGEVEAPAGPLEAAQW